MANSPHSKTASYTKFYNKMVSRARRKYRKGEMSREEYKLFKTALLAAFNIPDKSSNWLLWNDGDCCLAFAFFWGRTLEGYSYWKAMSDILETEEEREMQP